MAIPSTVAEFRPTRGAHIWATAVLTLLITAYRRPDAWLNPQFFVEDGTVFFADDYQLGIHALYKPYAGYLHLVPRLVAWLSSHCPLEQRPALYVWSCAVLLFGLSLLATHRRVDLPFRPAFALAPLLIPIGGFLYLHLTNIQWFLALAQLLVLLRRPPTGLRGTLGDCLVLGLSGLTGPFCLVTLCLWPLRLPRYGKSPHEWLCMAALLCCAGVQLHYLSAAQSLGGAGGLSHISIPWLAKQAANLLLGKQWPAHLGSRYNLIPALLLALTLPTLILGAPRTLRFQALVIGLFGAAFLALALYRVHPEAGAANPFTSGSRYFFLPHVCASWCALVALHGVRAIRTWAAGFLVMLLLSAATDFDRQWPQDFRWEKYCERIRSGQPVVVPINWPGWKIRLNFPQS